jgi:hypothetical protein
LVCFAKPSAYLPPAESVWGIVVVDGGAFVTCFNKQSTVYHAYATTLQETHAAMEAETALL